MAKNYKTWDALGWHWYLSNKGMKLDPHKCGKWMYFFSDESFAKKICEKAISEGVCCECKCTDMDDIFKTGVICFYLNGDDIENHKRVIRFMLDNDLIRKTKTGRYYDCSFKFDSQTAVGEYGSDFEPILRLSHFIDLQTGKWR